MHGTATYRCDDTRGCIIQFWHLDDKHMVLETCRGMKQTYCKTKFCASSWLITKINILRCTVNKTLKKIFDTFADFCLIIPKTSKMDLKFIIHSFSRMLVKIFFRCGKFTMAHSMFYHAASSAKWLLHHSGSTVWTFSSLYWLIYSFSCCVSVSVFLCPTDFLRRSIHHVLGPVGFYVYMSTWHTTAVAQWLRCCATNRKVAGSIPDGVSGFFIDMKHFRSHYGPGVDSASNRNEYQEYFLGVKVAGA